MCVNVLVELQEFGKTDAPAAAGSLIQAADILGGSIGAAVLISLAVPGGGAQAVVAGEGQPVSDVPDHLDIGYDVFAPALAVIVL